MSGLPPGTRTDARHLLAFLGRAAKIQGDRHLIVLPQDLGGMPWNRIDAAVMYLSMAIDPEPRTAAALAAAVDAGQGIQAGVDAAIAAGPAAPPVCSYCGDPIRRTEPGEGIDLDEYPWVHEDGNPICGIPAVAAP